MAQCTAPRQGHRTSSGRASCPACSSRYGGYRGYGGYTTYSPPSYTTPSYSSPSSSSGGRSSGGSRNTARARWSKPGSVVLYTPAEVRALEPVRESVEKLASKPDLRDAFLCHAWDDRRGSAKDLNDQLEALGVKVWFSEKDIEIGTPFLREIDKGLAKSRVGIVLVTPALLLRLPKAGVADKELSVLLALDRLIPVVHGTTYDALRDVSPMLASRNGFDTAEDSLSTVAAKLADLVKL